MTTEIHMKIGTNHADLDYFSNQFARDNIGKFSDPQCSPMEYVTQIQLGNGSMKGMGWVQQTLHWAFMTEAQAVTLRAYVGSINILTPNLAGTLTEYTCELVWPPKEPEHYAGYVHDVTVMLIKMVTV